MAAPGTGFFRLTGDPVVDAMTHGYYWVLGSDRAIDWSVANGFSGEYWNNAATVASYATSILGTFSYYANIRFNFVGYFATPAHAYAGGSELTISLSGDPQLFPSTGIWGRAMFPWPLSQSQYYFGEAGDVFLNVRSAANFLPTYAQGSAGWALFIHEMGHALGLKHPHDSGGTGRPTLTQIGLSGLDVDWATVMSYNDNFNWNNIQWDPATPMILDVLALQYLYGKNLSTNAGDSFYEFSRSGFYSTLWDASGNDSISVQNQSEGWSIVLPSLQLSGLVDTKAGFATPTADLSGSAPTTLIWLAGDIENAYGSRHTDTLVGSNSRNQLFGNGGDDFISGLAGNDVIDGGDGTDTSVYSGAISSYRISRSGGSIAVADKTGADGTDTVTRVERLQFNDKAINLAVKTQSTTVTAGTLKSLVELYIAFFNRIPDSDGMSYWLQQAASGIPTTSIADSFYVAAVQYAAITGYSPNMTNSAFVSVIYKNVLGRSSVDAEGLAYWTSALARGTETRGTLVKSILDSAHTFKNDFRYGQVANLLDNKYAVGKHFSIDLGLSFNSAEDSISRGMQIAAAVTASDTGFAIGLIGIQANDISL